MTKGTCSFVSDEGDPCGKLVAAIGLCAAHYAQQRKGRPLVPLRVQVRIRCSFVSDEGTPCLRLARAAGLCGGHYLQMRKGRPLTPLRATSARRPATEDPVDWFLSLFDTSGGPDACHEWQRSRGGGDYGMSPREMRRIYGAQGTHILKWILANGPIPDGLIVRHVVCDNPPCGNVAHLAIGTFQDNSDDMVTKGRSGRGEMNGYAKLTEEQVLDILLRRKNGESLSVIAAHYGVNKSTIGKISSGKRWKHLPRP